MFEIIDVSIYQGLIESMKKHIVLISLFVSSGVLADVPSTQINEVSHLLNYVKNSNCTINRNGSEYKGEKALKHIEKKYNYFRDDIKSTEDFIEYSATKSTMSGKAYIVICPDKNPVKTQLWLLDELKRYRVTSKQTGSKVSDLEYTVCKEPRPQICTMEYIPVCAKRKDSSFKTYASGCSACSDTSVIKYKAGQC